jgi:arsenate reductase (glutaredoxin)
MLGYDTPMPAFKIYHNPRCGKSRATLALLRDNGIEPEIVEYLKQPPSAAELKSILAALGMKPEQLVRRGEDVFKTTYARKAPNPHRAPDRDQRSACGSRSPTGKRF